MKPVKNNIPVLFSAELGVFELRLGYVKQDVFRQPVGEVKFKKTDYKVYKDVCKALDVVAWIPRQFIAAQNFNKSSEAVRLFLFARLEAADKAGYFHVSQLDTLFGSPKTKYRILKQALELGFIEKIDLGLYKVITMKRQAIRKRRGMVGLTQLALEGKKLFRSWVVASEARYMINQNRRSYDRFSKFKRADQRVKKFNELLNMARGECPDKERRSTRAKLQEYEVNEYKNLPSSLTKLCYQFLDPEKPSTGYVSNQMIADYFGISLTRASRYRWEGHKVGFHKVELRAVEITAFEAANAEYLEKYFKGRVFQKNGKFFVRMTSKVSSRLQVRTNKVKTKFISSI